jgi:hypothetical protein
MVKAVFRRARIGWALADAEFDRERNPTCIRQRLGAYSVIPAKRGNKTWRVRGVRAEMRSAFPRQLCRHRALIETVFSSAKRKLSARAPGRSLGMQMRHGMLLSLSFNLYRLRRRPTFRKMSTEPNYFYGSLQNSVTMLLGSATVPAAFSGDGEIPALWHCHRIIQYSIIDLNAGVYGHRTYPSP